MGPKELNRFLTGLTSHNIKHAVMIWGKAGIGKSSIVSQVAKSNDLQFVDVRLSQLMPSDLRGVPVPAEGITRWAPPSFLPTQGKGILFLDEINMAPPALQGVAQQLILDRKVGDYELPDGWFTWAAGNRADDRAAVYEMPRPLANRFLHIEAQISLDDFKQYAYRTQLNESIIGFLSFKSTLLHKVDPNSEAWPSPRTWAMASSLLGAGLPVDSAIGNAAAAEFNAYCLVKEQLPDIQAIIKGKSKLTFPDEPSVAYATISSLVVHVTTAKQAEHAFFWVIDNAPPEWVQLFATDMFPQLRERKLYQTFSKAIVKDPRAVDFIGSYVKLAA